MKKVTRSSEPHPPEPPPIRRSVRLARAQWIGIPIIALVPVLAMAGVFGERWTTQDAAGVRLSAHVTYPTRFRAKLGKPLTVGVENRSGALLDSVDVEIDSSYAEQFSIVGLYPAPRDAYVISLGALRAGETRSVRLELEAARAGRHRGRIVVRTPGDSVVVALSTTVFP